MTTEGARLFWLSVLDTNTPYYIAFVAGFGVVLALAWVAERRQR